MENPFKPISISLSPNVQADDVKLAFSLLFKVFKKQASGTGKAIFAETGPLRASAAVVGKEGGGAVLELEQGFKNYLGVKAAYSFNSGRSALMAILQALELKEGAQVLLQAFTCNAAVNPIRWAGLEPVFVDCDENYNLSVRDLEKKITARSRAVMVQHTFGLAADMDEIKKICDKNNLVLIEDCAHALGAEYKNKKTGTFGKAAFFSFGRDKMISCVYGGMAVTDDAKLAKKIAIFQKEAGYPSNSWTRQQLLHPVLMNWLVLPTYSILGKHLLVVFQWLKILSKAIHWKEKQGQKPDYFPKRLPQALAVLAQNQLKKLEKFNAHRAKTADFYYNELKGNKYILPNILLDRKAVYLRFAIRHNEAVKIIKKAWKRNLLVGDWYRTPVDPFDTRPETVGYQKGSCPNAENFAGKIINLPTHVNTGKDDARKIVDFIKSSQ